VRCSWEYAWVLGRIVGQHDYRDIVRRLMTVISRVGILSMYVAVCFGIDFILCSIESFIHLCPARPCCMFSPRDSALGVLKSYCLVCVLVGVVLFRPFRGFCRWSTLRWVSWLASYWLLSRHEGQLGLISEYVRACFEPACPGH
jgi:hypothetical protein